MKRLRKGLSSRSPWITFGIAVLLTTAAFALTKETPLRDGHPFLLFLAAVFLSSRFGGVGPGLVAGLLAVIVTAYFLLPPLGSFLVESSVDMVGLGVFTLLALVLSWLTAIRERARDRAETQAERQAALAELQRDALANPDRAALLDRAAALLYPLFDAEYAGIFQALPDGASLLLKSGGGWRTGMVGHVRIGIDTDGFVGGALYAREPLILRDLRLEPTSNVPRVFADHGVISGVTIVVPTVADQDPTQPFGVIGLYSTRRRDWAQDDIAFLQTMAQALANAIDHRRTEARQSAQRTWLHVALSSIGDAVIATDPQGRVALMNPVAQSLTGWSETEALSHPLDQILTIAGDKSGHPVENPVIKALSARTTVPVDDLDGELGHAVLVTKSSGLIPVDGVAAPMSDDQGRLIGSVLILSDASVHRQSERALRQSAERFRVALSNSPVVVFNQDTELRYAWIHNATRGFPPVAALGKTDADWMSPAEAARWTELKRGVLERGLGTREELAATVHGERRTFDLTVEPLRDDAGSVAGITCTCIDITERKREQATTARLAAIVESSEEAITDATLDGIILSWNPGAERLYGYAPDEIIGQPHSVLHPPGWQDEVRDIAERLKQGEPVEHRQAVSIRKDGSPVDVSVTMSLVRDNMGRIIGISSIARDITERKRMEEVQRFRTAASDLLSSSLDYEGTLAAVAQLTVPRIADWCSVHLVAEDGTIRPVALAHEDSSQVERVREWLSRYPPEPNATHGVPNVIRTGRPELVEHVTAEHLAALARDPEHLQFLVNLGLQSFMIVPLAVRRQTFGALAFACTTSGRRLTLDDLALAQDLANRAALWGDNARLFRELQKANEELEQRVVRRTLELQGANQQLQTEIAERRRTTEQLHQLSAHLQSAREEERISVAREIHDELGQILTAVRMDLDILERDLSQPEPQDGEGNMLVDIRATMRLVDDSIQKMHEIIRELRPEILDHLGLGTAIEWQAQEFQTRSGIECRLAAAVPDLTLDRDRSTAVFRILQEALTNVARHAQARRVEIQLGIQDGEIVLQVRDDGRGIAGGDMTQSKTFGILGMRERALVFGGHVDLHSEPGKGTAVVAHIPMEELHDSSVDRG